MTAGRSSLPVGLLATQIGLLACSVAVLALLPVSSGEALAIPLSGNSRDVIAADPSFRIVRSGPIAGSLIVRNRRIGAVSALLSHHILVVNAWPAFCGAEFAPQQS